MSGSGSGPTNYPITWGPGYIGLTVAVFLYGVELCQFVFYLCAFRHDHMAVRLQVFVVAVLDTVHFFSVVASFHYYVPWSETFSIFLVYCITTIVQVFYAYRVWIISGRNRIITMAVLVFTTLQLVFGLLVVIQVIQEPTTALLFSTNYVAISAVASAICDALVTFSIMYYLRPTAIRRGNYVKKLLVVFVHMGLFTFINSLAMVIMYYIENRQLGRLLTTAPGVILSKTYVNSMLGVLNARKPIRDELENAQNCPIELPMIPTLA